MIKIRFDHMFTPKRLTMVLFLGFCIFAIDIIYTTSLHRLHDCKRSILESQGLKEPPRTFTFLCHLPEEDCLCSETKNNSNISEGCVTRIVYQLNPQLLLLIHIIQIILIKNFFSLIGSHRRIVLSILRVLSVIIFIFIAIYINLNTCYEVYTMITLFFITAFLWCCIIRAMQDVFESNSVSNDTITIVVHSSERTRPRVKTWKELL